MDSHCSPLQPVYQGPHKVLAKFSKYFKLDMRHGINNVSIDRIKTAQIPRVSSPIVTTTRGRVIRLPAKLRDNCLLCVRIFFDVHCTYRLFRIVASRKQTSLDAASAYRRAMIFTAGSALARMVELHRGFCDIATDAVLVSHVLPPPSRLNLTMCCEKDCSG